MNKYRVKHNIEETRCMPQIKEDDARNYSNMCINDFTSLEGAKSFIDEHIALIKNNSYNVYTYYKGKN